MKHLGDITKIHGDKIEPVDCITFGSPCQDLSIAGCRAGLAGERSGLFMEAVRIIKEMRSNTNGLYPTFAVWENVPGAFSSNGGEDFRAVLEELARVEQPDAIIPRPPRGGRWSKAGAIAGAGWSLAWRQLDAQHWGVPQRRKRIALVADFGGQRASEILFERTGVSGHPDEGIQTRKSVAGLAKNCAAGNDRVVAEGGRNAAYTLKIRSGCAGGGKGALVQTEKTGTLSTLQDQTLFQPAAAYKVQVLNDQGGGKMDVSYDVVGTLRANAKGHDPIVIDALPFDTTQLTSPQNGSNPHWGDPCHPLAASAHTPSAVVKVYDARGNGNGKVVPTITGDHKGRVTDYTAIVTEPEDCLTPWDNQARRIYSENGTFPALDAREKAGQNQQSVLTETEIRWIVRRLTPTECERLQGYPDGWTDIGEWVDTKGKKHKPADSPRYKALGNSIALPQWFWLVQRMRPYLKEKHTLGSLFDGLGGFPLVWQRAYGEGTARWASEIEEFPIAVTKRRFGEE
jgi:DNA (cytosine-5)-methyltransferase 1